MSGIILIIYSIVLMNASFHCPAGGCPASYLRDRALEADIPFFVGILLAIIGIVFLMKSRSMAHDSAQRPVNQAE